MAIAGLLVYYKKDQTPPPIAPSLLSQIRKRGTLDSVSETARPQPPPVLYTLQTWVN